MAIEKISPHFFRPPMTEQKKVSFFRLFLILLRSFLCQQSVNLITIRIPTMPVHIVSAQSNECESECTRKTRQNKSRFHHSIKHQKLSRVIKKSPNERKRRKEKNEKQNLELQSRPENQRERDKESLRWRKYYILFYTMYCAWWMRRTDEVRV